MAAADDLRQAQSLDGEDLHDLPLKELLAGLASSVKTLATKEVELASAEMRSDAKASVAMAKSFGLAAICGLLGVNMLLVAAAFALAALLPGWEAALLVAAPFLLAAALAAAIGWARRVREPLGMTRTSLKESLEWAKDRLA